MLYKRVLATRLHKFYVENAKICEQIPNFGGYGQWGQRYFVG